MRVMQARVHAGPGRAAQQDLSPAKFFSALTDYDLGYTLEATASRLKKRAHRSVSPSTITSWLNEYKQHCSYRRLRGEGLKRFPADQTIRSIKLYHRQIYGYAFHRPKLDPAAARMQRAHLSQSRAPRLPLARFDRSQRCTNPSALGV